MSPPEPMLSSSARRWPEGGVWVLQPKWDGFRLLIEVGDECRVRAWSRHGTSPTARLGGLTAAFADVPPGSVFDGELVVVVERDSRPVQDFAAVCRAVLRGDATAAEDLRFVGFDVLALDGEDLRARPWTERNVRLTEALPVSGRYGGWSRCRPARQRRGDRGPGVRGDGAQAAEFDLSSRPSAGLAQAQSSVYGRRSAVRGSSGS